MLKSIPIVYVFLITVSGCKGLGDALTASRPVIDRVYAARSAVVVGDTTHVIVEARDLNGEDLDYVWSVASGNGEIETGADQPIAVFRAPVNAGTYTVSIRVTNESGKNRTATVDIQAVLSNIPIVTISSPVNGQFIPSNQGIVLVQSQITAALGVDSVKCFVGSVEIDPKNVTGTSVSVNFQWDVTNFTGSQLITVRAWSHQNTTVITGESSVQVSVEPVVGKTK
jgi:hypothetical protein